MRYLREIVLAAVSGASVACVSESRGSSVAGRRDTLPNGTIAVRYDALPDAATPPLEADLSIGVTEGDPHLVFGDIRGIEAGNDGTIYVLDYQSSEVRAYDGEGRYLRTLTKKGEGPGEITEANGMVLVGDTALWIQDHGKWMMLAVDLNGRELTRVRMHVLSYGYIWDGAVDRQGRFWKPTTHSDEPRVYPPKEGLNEGRARRYLKRYDAGANASDSIYLGEVTYRTFIARNSQGGYTYRGIPHEPGITTVVDPAGGFWQASGSDYRVARRDDRGDTVIVIEVAAEPIPVSAGDRARYVDDVVESSPEDRRTAEEVTALMPALKPAVAGLVLDDQGRLWVRRTRAGDEPTTYDVFRADGEYVASLSLGFEASPYLPLRIRRGRVYALVRDSLDVPSVIRTMPLPGFLR